MLREGKLKLRKIFKKAILRKMLREGKHQLIEKLSEPYNKYYFQQCNNIFKKGLGINIFK